MMTENDKKLATLFNELVPRIGKADSLAGEITRAAGRIGYRWASSSSRENLLLLREFRSRASSGLSRSPRSSGIRFSADDPGVPHRSIYRHPGGDQPAVLSSSRLIAPGMYPYTEICSLIGSFMQSLHRGLPILFRRKRSQ